MKIIINLFLLTLLTACIGVDKDAINEKLSKNNIPFENMVSNKEKTGIVFWKSNCGPCIMELEALNQGKESIIAINVGEQSLEKEIKKLQSKIDSKLKSHIQFQKNKKMASLIKEKIGINFVPFTVVVKDKKVSNFHVGYTDSL